MNVNIKYKIGKVLLSATFVLMFITLFTCSLHAEFILKDRMDDLPLAGSILCFEDKDCSITFDEIRKIPDSMYRPLTEKSVNLGYSDSIFWFKLPVENRSKYICKWIIESQYPLLDYISVFIPVESGYEVIHSGDRLPFSTMPRGYFNFTADISSKPGRSTIFIKVRSEGALVAKFRAWTEEAFNDSKMSSLSILWLFYGVMIALSLYCIFIFLSTKDRVYLALIFFILSCLMVTFIHNGMAKKYLWPDSPWWGNFSHPFFIFMGITTMLWFTSLYFNTKVNLRRSHFFLKILLAVSIPMSLIIFLLSYSKATLLSVMMTGIVSVFIILFVMLPMFTVNIRLAMYYLCSWFFFSMGDILLSLRSLGFIGESFVAAWSFQISLSTGIIFLSAGVADKLNSLQKEKERAFKRLRDSEERYRLFFETAHDAIVFYIDETPAYANRNMIEISGYSEKEFYTKTLFDLIPETGSSETDIKKIINDISSGKLSHARFEHVLKNKSGEELAVMISLSSITEGIHRGILMILSDISSMKKASLKINEQYSEIQEQLQRLESLNSELVSAQKDLVTANSELEKEKEYLSATVTSIGDGVISYDIDGKIFLMNSVAEELTGATAAEAIGKNIRDVLRFDDDSSKELLFDTLGTVSEKYNFTNIGVPFKLYDSENNERIIELSSAVIKLHEKPIGIVLALRDVTIKNRIDNELIKMSKLESIGLLAGGIAHDFNNLLTGISANVSLLNNISTIPTEVSDSLSDISRAVERASALTKQLLTFAKGGNPVMQSCRIDDIIKESVKFVVKDSSIKTEISIENDLLPVLIDPNQISQAINNLIINAIQAMPDGGTLSIQVKNADRIPPEIPLKTGKFIFIRISDTGCGIPRKNLIKIFDPFYTTKPNGTGFGLTSTYSIIKKHRGYIRVDSKENEGTVFQIFLRSSDELPSEDKIINTGKKTVSGGSVLIMDDEEYILEVLVKMLKYHGFSVTSAKTGEEAIALYRESMKSGPPFDYVILDLTVYNGMGGKETIEILRDIDPNVKAIVSSGYSDNPVLANYREYGFSGILTKPYVIEDVLKAVEKV